MANRKPKGYWTMERCAEDAKKYASRSEWSAAAGSGYGAAKRNGWLNDCCEHMISKSEAIKKATIFWDLDRCIEDAKRFSKPSEWQAESASAWSAAQRNGWLDVCQEHMEFACKPKGYWTLGRCKADALNYSTRADWERGNKSAKSIAERNGWMNECCQHMTRMIEHGKWTLDKCMASALRFNHKEGWRRGDVQAYGSARYHGWFDECTSHMSNAGGGDNDVVYLWRDAGTGLHKIGITSDKWGEKRINMCKQHNDMDPRIVFMLRVDDARAVEAELLKLGTDPELDSSIDGYTEFRVLTNEELGKAVSTAYQYAVAA